MLEIGFVDDQRGYFGTDRDVTLAIAIQKGNMSLLTDARNNVKRKYKAAEEAYILSGYEVPEE